MKPRDLDYLRHILAAAKLIQSFVQGKSEEDFSHDLMCQGAVFYQLQIIGEASRKLSLEIKKSIPILPWQNIIGMRNILVHVYENVNIEEIWATVERDLPKLISEIESYLKRQVEDMRK